MSLLASNQSCDTEPERQRVLDLIRRHGWNATAFQTLESGYRYFFHGEDACVAYVDVGGAWVVAGAPIADANRLEEVTAAFLSAARAVNKRCCFFATEERLRAAAKGTLHSLPIGEQPVWDPRDWLNVLASSKSLREQLRRARAKGVRIRELSPDELASPPVQAELSRIVERWLSTRGMARLEFLVQLDLFTFPLERRCFVAERQGNVVAFAAAVPVPARSGWFIEDLLREPNAPNGTGELLVDAVMRWAAAQGCSWLTLGLSPLAGDVPVLLRFARRTTGFLYDFRGVRSYKAKLRPSAWTPIYLSYPQTQGALWSLLDALAAFARGRLLSFALKTLLRGPTALIRLLAVLLVPWTLLIALAPSERWFGSPWLQAAWVTFDVLVAFGLFRSLARPSRRLVTALAIAVSADTLLTLAQALLINVRREHGFAGSLVIVVACGAPALAALVLWGARSARLRPELLDARTP